MNKFCILGIDPGTVKTGFALLHVQGNVRQLIDSGVIETRSSDALNVRYHAIFKRICELIKKYRPNALSIETQFVNKNVASAMKLSMARAAALIAATENYLEVYEYSPTLVKKAITTTGRATKEQIQKMTASLLGLKTPITSEDEADAVALALCHHFRHKRVQYV
jgi:crossover junction endodeoxyribonuclease RuvC